MRTVDVGLGARQVLAAPGVGRVVGVHRKALYLEFPAGLCAVTSCAAPPGPLHLRCTVLPPARCGHPVRADGRVLRGETWALGLTAPGWTGRLPPPAALGEVSTPREIAAVVPVLGGRGPGLTPEGDDLLAGLILVARAGGGPAVEAELVALAHSVPTNSIASAFLLWAARGQCIGPAHDVLGDLAGTRRDPGAASRLTAVGSSSGAALLAGLRLAASAGADGLSRALSTIGYDRLLS
ncbi:oxamate carbamoyltransferase subunit AllH family protein [Pseudonocardia sp. T1-2H]|uniref:oxamate carbamoyltransferase subunit AllH family protein n=1 Tax=Pseudonocardia sp. T1-2H TaxID=3128899 RepID=UPI0031012EE2